MKTTIGIIGPLAAGKDEVTSYLEKKIGVKSYQVSSVLKKILDERGVEKTRDNLISLGQELSESHGDGYLAEKLVEDSGDSLLIIGGMRQLGQIEYLQKQTNSLIIGVDASAEIRFERMKKRNKPGDPKTLEEFITIEKRDDGKGAQKISECMKLADVVIKNEGTTEELYHKIYAILEEKNII